MSEIKVDTLTGKATAGDITVTSEGGAATMQLQQGLGKAWVNYSQADNTVRDSLNITSVTDISIGLHAYVFFNNMSNANWAGGFITRDNRHQWNTDEGATTGRSVRVAQSNNVVLDCHSNTLICMGDLS